MISHWSKLLPGCDNKIVNVLYKCLYIQYLNDTVKTPWYDCIHRILNTCSFSNIWQQQENVNKKWIKNAVTQRLKDQFIQTRSNDMFDSSKGKIYRTFKLDFRREKYLEKQPPKIRNFVLQITAFQ